MSKARPVWTSDYQDLELLVTTYYVTAVLATSRSIVRWPLLTTRPVKSDGNALAKRNSATR